MFSLLAPLLSSSKFWLVVILTVTNGISFLAGRQQGYESGYAEYVTEHVAFTLFKEQALEAAMAAQVQHDAETAANKAANKEVTANYESLQTATDTAVRALSADRVRLLSAIAAASRHPTPVDPGTGLQADASAQDRVLGECVQRYETLGADAQRLSDTVSALQAYVVNVCKPE